MNEVNGPSLIMGDFNSIMSIEDRVKGNLVQEVEVTGFKNFIVDVGLAELRTIWRNYTRKNNHVYSRIDSILANVERLQKWPNMEKTIIQLGFSDYYPLKVTVADSLVKGKRPFKLFNCLAAHHEFNDIVCQCWKKRIRETTMLKVWYKLKQLKEDLK